MDVLIHNPDQPLIVITPGGEQIAMQIRAGSPAEKRFVRHVVCQFRGIVAAMQDTALNGAVIALKGNDKGDRKPEVRGTQ